MLRFDEMAVPSSLGVREVSLARAFEKKGSLDSFQMRAPEGNFANAQT